MASVDSISALAAQNRKAASGSDTAKGQSSRGKAEKRKSAKQTEARKRKKAEVAPPQGNRQAMGSSQLDVQPTPLPPKAPVQYNQYMQQGSVGQSNIQLQQQQQQQQQQLQQAAMQPQMMSTAQSQQQARPQQMMRAPQHTTQYPSPQQRQMQLQMMQQQQRQVQQQRHQGVTPNYGQPMQQFYNPLTRPNAPVAPTQFQPNMSPMQMRPAMTMPTGHPQAQNQLPPNQQQQQQQQPGNQGTGENDQRYM